MSNPTTAVDKPKHSVKTLVESEAYKRKFAEVLGKNAPSFVSSIVQLGQSWQLQDCQPHTVVGAAMIAASLGLPIHPSLGFAWIIPYKDIATFQIGYKGFVQLANRSGQYKRLNVTEVYDGELLKYDRVKGDCILDETKRKKDAKVIGYVAYFELINGHEHALYWPLKQVEEHAARFSQAYRSKKKDSPWFTDFDAMAKKTVLKSLLTHWGPLSTEMQAATVRDQSYETDSGEIIYPDNPETKRIEEGKPIFGQVKDEPKAEKTKKGKPANDEEAEGGPRPKNSKLMATAALINWGVPFDDFADFVVNQGVEINLRDKATEYETVPDEVYANIINSPGMLEKIVKTYGKKKE
jgi:recombination protein RecT